MKLLLGSILVAWQWHSISAAWTNESPIHRRQTLEGFIGVIASSTMIPGAAYAETAAPSREFIQQYDDFMQLPNGVSYRDVSQGKGEAARVGDRVVYDWSGYTIGYFGRPFQAKGGPKGGAFDKDLDYSRVVLGTSQIVPGLESAMIGMQMGGVRQIVVPFRDDLSYPLTDLAHERVGPKPTTFSGMRALNFVLENPRLDRTLLFNVKVLRIDKPDSKGGFLRGDRLS